MLSSELISIVGFLAGALSVSSFLPQAWKIIKSRDTHSISLTMYLVTVAGFTLWLIYGIGLGEWPIILTNGICLSLTTFILVMKWLPQEKKEKVADQIDPT